PSSRVRLIAPDCTFQARTAFFPVRPVSALAKQAPVKTSQVRASTYWPRILTAGAPVVGAGANTNRAGSSNRRFIESPPKSGMRAKAGGGQQLLFTSRPSASSGPTSKPADPPGSDFASILTCLVVGNLLLSCLSSGTVG